MSATKVQPSPPRATPTTGGAAGRRYVLGDATAVTASGAAVRALPLPVGAVTREARVQRELPEDVARDAQDLRGREQLATVDEPGQEDSRAEHRAASRRHGEGEDRATDERDSGRAQRGAGLEEHEEREGRDGGVEALGDEPQVGAQQALHEQARRGAEEDRQTPVLPAAALLEARGGVLGELADDEGVFVEQRRRAAQGELVPQQPILGEEAMGGGRVAIHGPREGHPRARELARQPETPQPARSNEVAHQEREGG